MAGTVMAVASEKGFLPAGARVCKLWLVDDIELILVDAGANIGAAMAGRVAGRGCVLLVEDMKLSVATAKAKVFQEIAFLS